MVAFVMSVRYRYAGLLALRPSVFDLPFADRFLGPLPIAHFQ